MKKNHFTHLHWESKPEMLRKELWKRIGLYNQVVKVEISSIKLFFVLNVCQDLVLIVLD